MSDKPIELVSKPKDYDYEDYICAYFQAGGLYVEKSIIYRETEELLELDIITSDLSSDGVDKRLIEIKSGNWSFGELFKIKGWLVYLNMEKGVFIVQNTRPSISYFRDKAVGLGINLIDNSDLSKTERNLSEYLIQPTGEKEIETLRFAYLMERKLLKKVKKLKKANPDIQSYKNLDDYFFKINSGSFFSTNPVRRIKQLFDIYLKYKNITAKVCYELEYGEYKGDIKELSSDCYEKLFYEAEDSILQVSLYIEHMARLTILKSCAEHLVLNHKSEFQERNFLERIEYLSLPKTIKSGLNELVKEPYFHKYPIFWQWFTYVLGGFILQDFENKEYEYLSKKTGIPIEEIPNAFDSFNKLFPTSDGWFFSLPNSNIDWHRFFPLPMSGIGANHRRFIHLDPDNDSYEELDKKLSGKMTMVDLIKWNNLGYQIIK